MNNAGCSYNKPDNGSDQCHSCTATQVNKRTKNHRKRADNDAKNAHQTLLRFILFGKVNRKFV